MKITAVEADVWGMRYPGDVRPAWAPGVVYREARTTLYTVHTDEGVTGIGAGVGNPTYVKDNIAPHLIDQDPFAIERHSEMLRSRGGPWLNHPIVWGIEMALWDLVGKAAGLPLYKLWGGYTDRVRAYASCMEKRGPEQRAEDALRYLDEGYKAIKLRIHDWTIKEDIAQVEAVRDAVGDRMEIMIDANQAQIPGTPFTEAGPVWSYERALATCRELEPLDITWLEEPLSRFDFENLSRLSAATTVPIAGGENNSGLHEYRWMIEQNVYDIIQADIVCSEGLLQLKKIAGYAEMHHKPFVPHHGGNGIGIAAHMQLSAACPNSPYVELLQEPPGIDVTDFQGVIAEPFVPDANGDVHLPNLPGLGVEIGDRWQPIA